MVYEKYRQEYASAAKDSRVAVRKMIGFFMVVSPVCRHGFVMVPCLSAVRNTVNFYSGAGTTVASPFDPSCLCRGCTHGTRLEGYQHLGPVRGTIFLA